MCYSCWLALWTVSQSALVMCTIWFYHEVCAGDEHRTHAISRTENPALMRPSQAKRKSTELGQSKAIQSGPAVCVFFEIIGLISFAMANDPFLKSSKAAYVSTDDIRSGLGVNHRRARSSSHL